MIKRIVFLVFLTALLVCAFCVPSHAEGKVVYDYSQGFTDEEAAIVTEHARKTFAGTGCSVYIVTAPYFGYYGEDFLYENPDVDKNSVILILSRNHDMYYDMYTYGKPDRRIDNAEVNLILDDPEVFNNIKYNGDYVTAAMRFITLSEQACRIQLGRAIAVACVIAGIVSAIVFFSIVCSYKKKLRSEKYPLDRYAKLELYENRDDFMGSFVTKRVISSGSGSRGGGGGGRSGGGGGHRGGR